MERYKNNIMGSVIINVLEAELRKVMKYLDCHNVIWKQIYPIIILIVAIWNYGKTHR